MMQVWTDCPYSTVFQAYCSFHPPHYCKRFVNCQLHSQLHPQIIYLPVLSQREKFAFLLPPHT